MESSHTTPQPRFPDGLRALRNRNYRFFFVGQGISNIGTWMQMVATSWLVFRLTGSSFMMGLVSFSAQLPAFIFSPVAGVVGDRFNRKKILIIAQAGAMAQASALAAVTLLGVVNVWQVMALGFVLGCVNAFEMPTRHALVPEMIEQRHDLSNAIALHSGLFNAARLVGPAIAGLLVASAGEGVCFTVNAVSFIAALAALKAMRIAPRNRNGIHATFIADLREGIAYLTEFPPIPILLAIVAVLTMNAMMFPVLLPIFAGRILEGGSLTYGFLVAASGLGALAATVFLARRRSVLGLDRVIAICFSLFGLGLIAFSFSRLLLLSLCILTVIGFAMIGALTSCNTIIQTIVDEEKRGRIMSFYIMVFMGASPFGSFLSGLISEHAGAQATVFGGGLLCLLGSVLFALNLPAMRRYTKPLFLKMGIIKSDSKPYGMDQIY